MEYPILNVKPKSRQMLDVFHGYNHNLRIGDGEFYDMKNMTSDYYPVLAPRKNRGVYKDGINAKGIIAKDIIAECVTINDKLCYVDGSAFVIGGERIEMGLNDKPKSLISMGIYVIIMPDKKWINTQAWYDDGGFRESDGFGDIDHEHTITSANIQLRLCTLTGEEYDDNDVRWGEKPAEIDGAVWLDDSTVPPTIKKYSEVQKMWVTIPTTYVKISASGIGAGLNQYDGVEISGFADTGDVWGRLDGFHTLWLCEDDYIVITGIPNTSYEQDYTDPVDTTLTISRKMPAMDFVIESNNRLWGCRYGNDNKGNVVNEIYASKLGDFRNWNCFMNLSTDSYAASCGTDGPFTGAIAHLGYPLFFKENCVHKVYGDYPANFRIQHTACRGVQKGSGKSLAIVNETLFYKSGNAVCAYDGSLPVEMSAALGEVHYSDAVACGHGNKYYIDMMDATGKYHLFVYDTAKGMWHKEDNLQVDAFCAYGSEIYAIESGTKNIITLCGSGSKDSEKVPWMVETGLIGMSMPDMKYISKLLVRMSLEEYAQSDIRIQYDSLGEWQLVHHMEATSLRSFAVPIIPRRCDHFRLRIEGAGECRIYSVTKTIEQGSDVS